MDKKHQHDKFELDDELDEQPGSIQHFLTIGLIFVAACGFVGLSWYAYNSYNSSHIEKVPIIQADTSPTKISPQDPGGMKIPNMDKQVYGRFSKKASAPNVERILPGPEEPVNKNVVISASSQGQKAVDTPPLDGNKQQEGEPDSIKSEKPDTSSVAKEKTAEAQKVEDNSAQTKQEAASLANQNPPTPNEMVTNLPKGSRFSKSDYKDQGRDKLYRVQIASFKSEKDAKESLKKQFSISTSPIFASYKFFVEKKNLPSKGLVYRLQIGELESEAEAQELCKKLKNSGIDCFTVRP